MLAVEKKEVLKDKVINGISHLDSDGLRSVQFLLARIHGEDAQEEMTNLWDKGVVSDEIIDSAIKEYRSKKN